MNVGEIVLDARKRNRWSRRELSEMSGLSQGKIGNIEKGREIKPEEREALLPHIPELDGNGVESPQSGAIQEPQQPNINAPDVPPAAREHDKQSVIEAYNNVMSRLGGKPAPFTFPSLYRIDTVPPSEYAKILKWCQRIHDHLDAVEAATRAVDRANIEDPVIHFLDEDEEVIFVDVISPTASAPLPSEPPLVEAASEGPFPAPPDAVSIAVTPTEDPPTDTRVGVAALYDDGIRHLSNSEVQAFKHCRRRWWLGTYRGLKLKGENLVGVAPLGTRIHGALAEYYVPDNLEPREPMEALEDLIREDEEKVVGQVASIDASDAATKLADFQKEADLARAMVEGYVQWLAETGADQAYRVIAPEQRLSTVLEMPGNVPNVKVTGKLDVRIRRVSDDVTLFMDHKTVGNFEAPKRMLILDEQMKQYHMLEEDNRASDDPPVQGALYNMLRRVKRTQTAKPPFYERVEVHRNPQEITNFRNRLEGEYAAINHVERALEAGVNHQQVAYPSPGDRCTWGCEFSAVCPMFDDGSRAEDFISEHYEQINPMQRYIEQKGK